MWLLETSGRFEIKWNMQYIREFQRTYCVKIVWITLDRLRQATLYTNSSKRNIEMMVYEKCHQFWWRQLLAKLDQHTERIDNTAGYILTWDLLKKFYLKKEILFRSLKPCDKFPGVFGTQQQRQNIDFRLYVSKRN